MLLRVVPAALAVAVIATACGGGGQSRQAAVTAYLKRVDAVEAKLARPMKAVATANQDFTRHQSSPKAQKGLERSAQTLATLRRRLAAVDAPPDTQRLRQLLLELVDRETSLTHELIALNTFVPRFQSALQPVGPAGATLKRALAERATGAAAVKRVDADKAAALRTFAVTLDGVIRDLNRLHPPAAWRPGYASQLDALTQLRATGTALARAIAGNDAAAVPSLLRRFDAAAIVNQTVPAQRAQIAAVQAYNARVRSLLDLARKVERERNRLQRVTT